VIVQSPQNQSVCEGGTVNFICVVMFNSGAMPGGAAWYTDNGNTVTGLPGHTESNDVDGRSAPANVTNVLTITNVSMRRSYVCAQGLGGNQVISSRSFLNVLGELVKCFVYLCTYVVHRYIHRYACMYAW